MKLQTFNAANMGYTRKSDACISFSRSTVNTISKAAVLQMQLNDGDEIGIHQDEENPDDWYISLAEEGFQLRSIHDSGVLGFNNAGISNALLDYCQVEGARAKFRIGSEPTVIDEVQYWPIITGKPIINTRKNGDHEQ